MKRLHFGRKCQITLCVFSAMNNVAIAQFIESGTESGTESGPT